MKNQESFVSLVYFLIYNQPIQNKDINEIVGINIGKNKSTESDIDDYLYCIEKLGMLYHLNQQVEKIAKMESNEWLVETSLNNKIRAKCIVIAAGAGSFVPRKIPLENLDLMEEKNILYAVRNKSILEGKDLLIAGGGDSALDWTNELSKISNVTALVIPYAPAVGQPL